jgi:hypothetical protein
MSLKTELLQAIIGKNRGLLATEKDNVNILTAVEKLEDHNPTTHPLAEPQMLDGDWRLLYTTSKSILNLENLPLAHLGEIYQCIRTEAHKIYNIAEISGVPFLDGLVSVAAKFEVVSDKRINVKFNRSIIGLQRLLGYLSPKDLITKIETGKHFPPFDFNFGDLSLTRFLGSWWNNNNESSWLETTYLDDNLRIGRGHLGNVFILEKYNS